jgi:O-antigen ligase
MPPLARRLVLLTFQAIVCGGALAITPALPDSSAFKVPIMLLGILGLLPLLALRMKAGIHLLPGLLLFAWLYARLAPSPGLHEAALGLLAAAAAFLLGITRVPLADVRLLLPVALLCLGRGVMDLVTLTHLGGDPPPGHTVTSFFGDKHVAGGMLVLGAFLHFHLMERDGPQKPVQVLLYTSGLAVLLGMVLSDSRVAQGAFAICFLPLLFLTIRLDGKEPAPERLAWIAGITLCLGLAWINLPEVQLRRVTDAFTSSEPGRMHWAWTSAAGVFEEAPLLGGGVGGFQYAAIPHMGSWTEPGTGGRIPTLEYAHNHYLQVLAEAGAPAASLEAFLLLIALFGMAVIYFRENRLQAKYGFFSLAALALIGFFTSALDRAPLSVAYWALIGYGWSFAVEGIPRWIMPYRAKAAEPRGRDRAVGVAASLVLGGLILWHLGHRAKELQSVRLYQEAQSLAALKPKESTDRLAEALRWDPMNVQANYSYARVLAFFRREEEALKRVEYVQSFAPDGRMEAEILGEVYEALRRPDEAARQAARILGRYPYNLAAQEKLAGYLRLTGRCEALDSFRLAAARLAAAYPMPRSREYTIQGLDSLFMSNREISFLQRWFAGRRLRKGFVERRQHEYNRSVQYHSRAQQLREARCPEPGEADPHDEDMSSPYRTPALNDTHDPAEPAPPRRRRKVRRMGRPLACIESPAPPLAMAPLPAPMR